MDARATGGGAGDQTVSYISSADYFGPWASHSDATLDCVDAAQVMLDKVNGLLEEADAHGVELKINPRTHTHVAGETFGGFRPQDCPQGAPASAHKIGRAVDVYDPDNALDAYVTDAILEAHGLYREAPNSTVHWCHMSDKAPGSGRRTFQP